jgi:UDP-N-acetylmuramoyl-tripeptide--D-alanyl-D-alanine ligase
VDRPGVRVWASDVRSDDLARRSFTLHISRDGAADATADVALRVLGSHAVDNAVAAAAVAVVAGVGLDTIAAALSAAGARSRWRMELTERADGVAVLNDAYNANPDSMRAGLQALADLGAARRAAHPSARTVAVLGVMRELGPGSPAAHREVGRLAAEFGVDHLVCLGEFATDLAAGAGVSVPRVDVVAHKDDVAALLAPTLMPGDVVLIKASRGAELDTVAEDVLHTGGQAC